MTATPGMAGGSPFRDSDASRSERLERRVRELEIIVYMVIHDLRGGADQARYDLEDLMDAMAELPENFVDDRDLAEIAGNLAAAIRQQATLIDGIDAMVHMWDKGELTTETFDASGFLREQIESVDLFVGEDIQVADLGQVTANKGMFWAILFNLLKNALKYNDKPHKEVRVARRGLALCVADNGNGIPAAKLGVITRPFQRLDLTKDGKGLGLTICQALLEKHGWSLEIRSGVGEGSEFIITMHPGPTEHSP